MILNALAALAVAAENGIPMERAAKALEAFNGLKGRQQIHHAGGITIIDDSYNASPVSMKAGIQVLCDMEVSGRRAAVLADMKELGPETREYHRQVGHFLAEHPVEVSDTVWDGVSCVTDQDTATTNFFELYEEYFPE